LTQLYEHDSAPLDRPVPLSELAVAGAQDSLRVARAAEYWRDELRTAMPLRLHASQTADAAPPRDAGFLRLDADPALLAAVETTSRSMASTRFLTALAVFHLALSRWSGADDIVVMCPIVDRSSSALERTVGFRAFPAFVRAALSPAATVTDLVPRLRAKLAAAFEHRAVDLASVGDSGIALDQLSDVVAVSELAEHHALSLGMARLEPLQVSPLASGLGPSLCLHVMEGGPPALALALSYRRERVSVQTVESIASHIQRILEGLGGRRHVGA